MSRILAYSAAALAFCVSTAFAAPAKPAPAKPAPAKQAPVKAAAPQLAVPAFPGAKPVMELTIGENDMLNWITQVLPAMASMASAGGENSPLSIISQLDLNGLAAALNGLKQVKVVEMALPKKPDASAEKVLDFYTAALEKESGWTRVYWKSTEPNKSLAVFSLPNAEGIFITSIKVTPEGGKVIAGRTSGRIDLAKVIEWAAKNFEQLQSMKGEEKASK